MKPDIEAKRDAFLALIRREIAIMGILNITPDSFSDGGRYASSHTALAQGKAMLAQGCDIIDIGGESTRPGAETIEEDEELRRIIPIVSLLSQNLEAPLSIDTYKASVARKAAQLGSAIINDIWGLQGDPAMAETAAECGCAVVMMHNRNSIDESIDIIKDMKTFFERSLSIAQSAGLPLDRLILDPGIGFGKSLRQNLACIRELKQLKEFGLPLLLGVSRKSFIGKILDVPVGERLVGTLAVDFIGVLHGAAVLRVHDVKEHRQMLNMLKALEAFNAQ